jgi:hypothetical protein
VTRRSRLGLAHARKNSAAASTVRSISVGPCAVETKSASNWEGAT